MGGGTRHATPRRRKPVRIDAAAALEIHTAITWYQRIDPALAARFALAIDQAVAKAGLPMYGVVVPVEGTSATIRRVLVRRFPYAIYYLATTKGLRILAVAHQRREPGYWLRRI